MTVAQESVSAPISDPRSRSRSPPCRNKDGGSCGVPESLPASWWSARVAELVTEKVESLMNALEVADAAHNMDNVLIVASHVKDALMIEEKLDEVQKAALYLAALLHEVDDDKLFKTENSANSRRLLAESLPEGWEGAAGFIELVAGIIKLVSSRKNQDKGVLDADKWKLIVRDAHNLEAIGYVGIARCYAHNLKENQKGKVVPLFRSDTPRAKTVDELFLIATPERFAAYCGDSVSMIDYYYDQLLHLGRCSSGSPHLEDLMSDRLKVMVNFVLGFGRAGTVDEESLDKLTEKYCPGAPRRPSGVDV